MKGKELCVKEKNYLLQLLVKGVKKIVFFLSFLEIGKLLNPKIVNFLKFKSLSYALKLKN